MKFCCSVAHLRISMFGCDTGGLGYNSDCPWINGPSSIPTANLAVDLTENVKLIAMIDVVELENSKTLIDLFQSTNPMQIIRWKFWGDTEHVGNKNKQCHAQNPTLDCQTLR